MDFQPFGKSHRNTALKDYDRRQNARRIIDRREAQRVKLARKVLVRYFVVDREFEGTLLDISSTGMRVIALNVPAENTTIQLYLEQIGRIDGRVIQSFEDGFSLSVNLNGSEKKRLESWFSELQEQNLTDSSPGERRQEDRRASAGKGTILKDIYAEQADGSRHLCELASLSISGAEILTTAELSIGEEIRLNGTVSVVRRKIPDGYQIYRGRKQL